MQPTHDHAVKQLTNQIGDASMSTSRRTGTRVSFHRSLTAGNTGYNDISTSHTYRCRHGVECTDIALCWHIRRELGPKPLRGVSHTINDDSPCHACYTTHLRCRQHINTRITRVRGRRRLLACNISTPSTSVDHDQTIQSMMR